MRDRQYDRRVLALGVPGSFDARRDDHDIAALVLRLANHGYGGIGAEGGVGRRVWEGRIPEPSLNVTPAIS